jgi:hypothetical protein
MNPEEQRKLRAEFCKVDTEGNGCGATMQPHSVHRAVSISRLRVCTEWRAARVRRGPRLGVCAHLPTCLRRYITYKELLQAIRRTDPAMAEDKIKVGLYSCAIHIAVAC